MASPVISEPYNRLGSVNNPSDSSSSSSSSSDSSSSGGGVTRRIIAFVGVLFIIAVGLSIATLHQLSSKPPSTSSLPSLTDIRYLHVISSNHLDVGFNAQTSPHTSAHVVDLYFTKYFPAAVSINSQLNHSAGYRYRYMTQSWLVDLYLDCPPHMNFTCPTADEVKAFRAALSAGDIYFHAFPFNGEAEAYDVSLFSFAINRTIDLAKQTSVPIPRTMSQRDVPGLTRSAIPLLNKYGVTRLTLGVNGFSPPPSPIGSIIAETGFGSVNRAFKWRHSVLDASGAGDILTIVHGGGYGGTSIEDVFILPGVNRALIMQWNGDNAGPLNATDVVSYIDQYRQMFPNAEIIASTFDEYFDALLASDEGKAAVDNLPIITDEIGDTWIFGIQADPMKTAKFRALQRARTECEYYFFDNHECGWNNPSYVNFSRLLLKGGEHTYGGDTKRILGFFDSDSSYYDWPNELLAKDRNRADYQMMEYTWDEQRMWAHDVPLSALSNDTNPALLSLIRQELQQLQPSRPSLDSYQLIDRSKKSNLIFHVQSVTIEVCNKTGALIGLSSTNTPTILSADHPLFVPYYQTQSESRYTEFMTEYGYINNASYCDWCLGDYGKPKADLGGAKDRLIIPHLDNIYYQGFDNFTFSLLFEYSYPDEVIRYAGAPRTATHEMTFSTQPGPGYVFVEIDSVFQYFNRSVSRLPDAMWMQFSPILDPDLNITLSKLGARLPNYIDVRSVVVNGSSHLHAFDHFGVVLPTLNTKFNGMLLSSKDVSLASIGLMSPLPTPLSLSSIDQSKGVFINLSNNAWNTNYPLWSWRETDAKFRFHASAFL